MATQENIAKFRRISRERRHSRVRKKVAGTSDQPRLCVFRSLKNIYAQVVDDGVGATIVAASSLDEEVKKEIAEAKGKIETSKAVGRVIAKRAKEKGIEKVCFDRSGYKFHGRVKALADAAREGGLVF